jgi:NAD(P)-dependent dehydrogenase (short-subunit alcohol dehydrogenase family)
MSNLGAQHAVVTGGGSGIGAAIATALVQSDARVTLVGRNTRRLAAKAEELGVSYQTADVTQRDQVGRAFAAAAEQCGTISILINNAGAAEAAPFEKLTDEQWDKMLAVNLTGVYNCTKAAIDGMLRQGFGRVVNIASVAGLEGAAYVSAYCAAKHGVVGLTRALAAEVGKKGITVNAVCPGYTNTDIVQKAIDNIVKATGRSRDEALAELVKANPQGRLIEPEEVAETVICLCSQASMNGRVVGVTGDGLT